MPGPERVSDRMDTGHGTRVQHLAEADQHLKQGANYQRHYLGQIIRRSVHGTHRRCMGGKPSSKG